MATDRCSHASHVATVWYRSPTARSLDVLSSGQYCIALEPLLSLRCWSERSELDRGWTRYARPEQNDPPMGVSCRRRIL